MGEQRALKAVNVMAGGHLDFPVLNERLRNLQETDMAVVVSPGQNEISQMKEKGFDILPHRERMVKDDLETKFKDPQDPFRLVFVCAMRLTGFDAPSCSTLYLDKPMRGGAKVKIPDRERGGQRAEEVRTSCRTGFPEGRVNRWLSECFSRMRGFEVC